MIYTDNKELLERIGLKIKEMKDCGEGVSCTEPNGECFCYRCPLAETYLTIAEIDRIDGYIQRWLDERDLQSLYAFGAWRVENRRVNGFLWRTRSGYAFSDIEGSEQFPTRQRANIAAVEAVLEESQ